MLKAGIEIPKRFGLKFGGKPEANGFGFSCGDLKIVVKCRLGSFCNLMNGPRKIPDQVIVHAILECSFFWIIIKPSGIGLIFTKQSPWLVLEKQVVMA